MELEGVESTRACECSGFRSVSSKPCGKPKHSLHRSSVVCQELCVYSPDGTVPDHTEATMEYMEIALKEFPYHKDVFSRFCTSRTTKKILEALTKQLTLDKHEEGESDPTWKNLSTAAKCLRIDEDKMQIEIESTQHRVDDSHFHFGKMHLLNHFSHHIR
jgi:hypothetical protein